MSPTEGQYTLEYYTKDDADEQQPPFKYRTFYLEDALAEGWQLRQAGGGCVRLTRERQIVFEKEELERIFARISELAGAQGERQVADMARQVMQEQQRPEVF